MGHVGDVGDIADTPKGHNAIFVGDIGDGYYQDDTYFKIELIPAIVLSSRVTN